MKSKFFFIRIFSVLTVAILLTGLSFGQGKGHGGGKGGGGGNPGGGQERRGGGNPGGGQEQRGGGNPGGGQERRGGGNPWGGGQHRQVQQVQREQPQQWRQEQRQQVQRQQPQQWRQEQRQQVQRQQPQQERRQQEQRQQVQRQQPQQWQVQRQQQAQQWQVQRQQRDSMRHQQMQQRQWQNIQRQQQRVYTQPQQPPTNWGQIRREQAFEAKRQRDALKYQERANREDWKYERKQQHFADKDMRRAGRQYQQSEPYVYQQRDEWLNNDLYQPKYRDYQTYEPTYRDYRTYGSNYPQYYQPDYRIYDYAQGYYPNPGYAYDNTGYYGYQRSSWVEPLIRSVIATFFSSGISNGYYDDYAYGDPYYGNEYGYEPQYSSYQPTYYTFGYAPSYTYYEPASYYGYDQYAYSGVPYDAFQGGLPYSDVVSIYSGGLAGEMIQRALGTGYYQGLLEGQMARQRGWGDRYYSDPYLYEQAIYDPYSSSLGDCRRHFSEGYEMGYEDALRGRDEFDLADGGDVDLVSLLLGNVLSLRG